MSARGVVNRELATASSMIGLAEEQAAFRHCAAQLLFAFRSFLLELAELHRLPVDREYADGGAFLDALAQYQGAGASIAELEAFVEKGWGLELQAAQQAYLGLRISGRRVATSLDQNLINAVQVTDSEGLLSKEQLADALYSLQGLVSQMRELSQEY